MKITLLGTGAGEGYPGRWCDCAHCAYARAHGGRNLRSNSCALVDDTLLLDMNAACFDNAARLGISLSAVTGLCVTHPHEDHLYTQELNWRTGDPSFFDLPLPEQYETNGPRFTPLPLLNIYGGPFTRHALESLQQPQDRLSLRFQLVVPGESFAHEGFRITPVQAQHAEPGYTYTYVLEREGRTLLYALDTGGYDESSLSVLKRFRYDLMVLECTGGLRKKDIGHMNFYKVRSMLDFFRRNECLRSGARVVLSHMSPHWTPPYDLFVPMAEEEGMIVGYDGLSLEV